MTVSIDHHLAYLFLVGFENSVVLQLGECAVDGVHGKRKYPSADDACEQSARHDFLPNVAALLQGDRVEQVVVELEGQFVVGETVGHLSKFLVGEFVGFRICDFVMPLHFYLLLAGNDSESELLSSGVEVDQISVSVVLSFLQFGQFDRPAEHDTHHTAFLILHYSSITYPE